MENKITGGEWNAKDGQIYSLQTGKTLALIPYWDNEPEQAANAQLIADAGTTANKCGLLPSELLAQRDELLEALRKLLKSHRQLSAEYENKIMDTPIEDECYLLIKKVREEQP